MQEDAARAAKAWDLTLRQDDGLRVHGRGRDAMATLILTLGK